MSENPTNVSSPDFIPFIQVVSIFLLSNRPSLKDFKYYMKYILNKIFNFIK
jgi:hypothetical protein